MILSWVKAQSAAQERKFEWNHMEISSYMMLLKVSFSHSLILALSNLD